MDSFTQTSTSTADLRLRILQQAKSQNQERIRNLSRTSRKQQEVDNYKINTTHNRYI